MILNICPPILKIMYVSSINSFINSFINPMVEYMSYYVLRFIKYIIYNYGNISSYIISKYNTYNNPVSRLKVTRHNSNILYHHNNKEYYIILPKKKNVLYIHKVYNIIDNFDNNNDEYCDDVTDEFLKYLGPYNNFYGNPTTVKMLGFNKLKIHYGNGVISYFDTNDIINYKPQK